MPIYTYECKSCNKQFEIQQKMSDPKLTICKDCDGELKKLITSTSFVLKGGGWYADGYGDKKKGKAREEAQVTNTGNIGGMTTKTPIIKDRISGRTLSGPNIPSVKK